MLVFTSPEISESIGKIIFTWPAMELKVIADRITDAGTAELWFYHQNDSGDALLHTTKANLLSTSTMGQIGKRMGQHSEDIPWQQVLTYISAHTMELQRHGESPLVIDPDLQNIAHPGFYVDPIVLKNSPSVIYGDKGVNKTTLCLTLLGIIATNYSESPTSLACVEKANVGLLDWESNAELTNYTLARLIKGNTIPHFKLPYLQCRQNLADDIERVSNFVQHYSLQIILLDSLGQAAGADKFDTAGKNAALKFFECVRKLKITPLIIAQNAKNENDSKKTIYGSTYFTYYARNIFELKAKQDDLDDNIIHLALLHQESNYSKKSPALGFSIAYTETTIQISSEPVSFSQFLEKASQTKALLEFLKDGAKSRQAISQNLNVSVKQTDVILNRAKKRSLIINLGSGMWGLKTIEEPDA